MTELLCLKDSYLKEFSSKITAIEGNSAELEATAFYPQGGGQPSDTGKILFEGMELEVLEVKKDGGRVWHKLKDASGLFVGSKISGKIDWGKRYRLMRMHTSAHVMAAIIFRDTKKLITGNQIGWPQTRMDFNADSSFSERTLEKLECDANTALAQNHAVGISFMPREEALKNPALVRLKDLMPPALKEWRIVKIGGIDIQADGGTHVKNTSEVGQIKITATQNKGADNKRIYWQLK